MKNIKFSKKTVLILLFCLILINIVMRYPSTPHEIGQDGFANQALAKYISQEGYASWHTSPLSFFGLGSFTYPAGYQFLLSGLSQLTGLSLEVSVLVMSILVGVCSAFFAFLMVREIFRDNLIALISAFLFSTSPLFLRITNWNGSARQLLMLFLPLLIFLLLRLDIKKRIERKNLIGFGKYTALAIVLLITMGMIHRLALYLIFIIAAYFLSFLLFRMMKTFTAKNGIMKMKKHTILMILLIVLWFGIISSFVFMQLTNIGPYEGMNLWYKYQWGFFFTGNDAFTVFTNMIVDYGSSYGILSIFGLIGIMVLFRKRDKGYSSVFIILSIVLLSPLFTIGLYTQILVFIFFFILIAIGLAKILTLKKLGGIALPILVALMVISIGFSGFMIDHWQSGSSSYYFTEKQYDTALFSMKYMDENETFITNHQVFGNRILGIVDAQFLTEGFPYPLIYGWVDKEMAKEEFSLQAIIENKTPVYNTPLELEITNHIRGILLNDVEHTESLQSRYDIEYVIESPISSISYRIKPSLQEKKYIIYSNGNECIWNI